MLSLLAFLLALLTLCLIAMQVIYVFGYQAFMNSAHVANNLQDKHARLGSESALGSEVASAQVPDFRPPTAIVLCLKGQEENLVECLTGLICQEYTDYQLFIIVDSQGDPVLETVASFFADRKSKPIVQTLRSPLKTCSLKCSAIIQAIGSVASRYEVIAFIDADTIPDQFWLSDLVTPLADPSVGATTGNRWYAPQNNSPGAWMRKIWNAAAVVQMQRYQVPWGGSLALRTETIKRCGLVELWQKTFCEDTALIEPLKKHKLTLHRVPDLVLECSGSISLSGAFEWITRQLLTVRLHHPKWSWVAAHALASGLVAIASPVVIILMLIFGEFRSMWTLIQAYLAWQVINSWLLWLIEKSNSKALDGRESFNRLPNSGYFNVPMQFCGTLLTQWMYPLAAWEACFLDQVWWRGVSYKVDANGTVELIEKTDAVAGLRSESKDSQELLALGFRPHGVDGDEDDRRTENPRIDVSSHF